MAQNFQLTEVNPNVAIGGSGCVCNPAGDPDCKPPFAIFPAATMEENLSPHCVVSLSCMGRARQLAQKKSNILSAGEAS